MLGVDKDQGDEIGQRLELARVQENRMELESMGSTEVRSILVEIWSQDLLGWSIVVYIVMRLEVSIYGDK